MENTRVIKNIILCSIVLATVSAVIFYNKFEDAKYAFNRNCYYRLENLENVGNTGSLDKYEIINKEKWLSISSEINKFDEDFKEQYGSQFATTESK